MQLLWNSILLLLATILDKIAMQEGWLPNLLLLTFFYLMVAEPELHTLILSLLLCALLEISQGHDFPYLLPAFLCTWGLALAWRSLHCYRFGIHQCIPPLLMETTTWLLIRIYAGYWYLPPMPLAIGIPLFYPLFLRMADQLAEHWDLALFHLPHRHNSQDGGNY